MEFDLQSRETQVGLAVVLIVLGLAAVWYYRKRSGMRGRGVWGYRHIHRAGAPRMHPGHRVNNMFSQGAFLHTVQDGALTRGYRRKTNRPESSMLNEADLQYALLQDSGLVM